MLVGLLRRETGLGGGEELTPEKEIQTRMFHRDLGEAAMVLKVSGDQEIIIRWCDL